MLKKLRFEITSNSKICIFLAILIYILGILSVFMLPLEEIKPTKLPRKEVSLKNPEISFFLQKNTIVILVLIIGAFTLGITTFINLFINGMSLGILFKISKTWFTTLLLVVPHGIFEIPAIIMAGAAGFKIPYEIIRYLAGKKEQVLTKEDIKEYLMMALISTF